MPFLLVLGEQLALSYRENVLVVIKFVSVEAKELEQKFRSGCLVLVSKTSQLLNVVGKVGEGPIGLGYLVWRLMQTGENGRTSQLQERDDQTNPGVRT